MTYRIVLLPGDGIGPEITRVARAVIVPKIEYPDGTIGLSSFRATAASAATLDEELGEHQIF